MASLGTAESRMIKQARKHVQVKDRVKVSQVWIFGGCS